MRGSSSIMWLCIAWTTNPFADSDRSKVGTAWPTTLFGSGFGTDGGGNLDADPELGALLDNGGFTPTLLPDAGSIAIDAGDDAACGAAPVSGTDQRGVHRPQGAHCDIGAVEAASP